MNMFWKSIRTHLNGICGFLATGTALKVVKTETESRKSQEEQGGRPILIDGYKLKLVQIFVRHGARTPIHTTKNVNEVEYDKDMLIGDVRHTSFNYKMQELFGGPKPHSGYDQYYATKTPILKGGSIRGRLTKYGQDQMYIKGQLLRKQYIEEAGFIDCVYQPDQVHIRSTNISRTILTAQCIAAGMFGRDHLNTLKEPLAIHISEPKDDVLIPRTSFCHVLRQINHLAMIHSGDLPAIKQDRLTVEKLIGITEQDSNPQKHKINFIDIRDDIVARETHGLSDIRVLRPYRPLIEKHASTVMYYAFCGQHEAERHVAKQLSTGPLLNMIINNLQASHSNKTKLYIFSCHDSTLVGLLGTLGIYDFSWPPFGADVRFELYENSKGGKFVRVSYEGKDMVVEGCSAVLCPLEEFKSAMEPYVINPKQFREICDSSILEIIAQEMMAQEEGEEEDEETTERSDTPAGM